MSTKISGFKIVQYACLNEMIIKRKQISVIVIDGVYHCYSYHDDGYKVHSFDKDKNTAISNAIFQAKSKLKSPNGFPLINEYGDPEKDDVIHWWEKGDRNTPESHYKCSCNQQIGIGSTLIEALNDLMSGLAS